MRIWMLNVLNRMLRNEFECWNNSIAQSHHHSSLNWMTVLQTCCIFCEFERHKFRFDWRQCKIECWENEIEWQLGCAWPKSSKLNAHKMNLVDKITKLTGKTYTYGMALYINDSTVMYTDKTLTLRKSICERASLEKCYILKLLFLSIFCWYFRYFVSTNDMLVGLHVATNFEMYSTKLWKSIMGGNCPPALPPPPPPGYANGWQCQGSRYMILPGICARSARQI